MRLLETKITNFGPFKSLSYSLDKLGLTSILGENKDAPLGDSNGSGKSMIVEAVTWCLWGETIRGLKNDEVVNLKEGKNCSVSQTFEDDGVVYEVIRTRLMEGKKPNDLVLKVNGANASQRKLATQDKINQILGMDFNTFCAMMPGAKVKVAELTDAKVKELLESILQTSTFSAGAKVARGRLAALESQKSNIEHSKRLQSQSFDDLTAHIKDLAQKNEHYETDRTTRVTKLTDQRKALDAQIVAKQSIIRDKDKAEDLLKELRDKHHSLTGSLVAHEEKISKFKKEAAISRDSAVRSEAVRKQQLKSINKQLVDLINMEACNHCRQPMTAEYRSNLKEQLLQDQRVAAALVTQVQELIQNFEISYQSTLTELHTNRVKLEKEKEHIVEEIAKTNEFLRFSVKDANSVIESLQKQQSAIDDQVYELYTQVNPYEGMIHDIEAKQAKLALVIDKDATELEAIEQERKDLQFWVVAFSPQGLRSFLLDNVTPFLNQQAQYYADILTDGELEVKFHTKSQLKSGETQEKFYIEVSQVHGAASYAGSSDGEKRRAEIAIAMSLGDLASLRSKKKWPFKFMDEPFENLDESGVQAVIKLLQEQASKYDTILVVTHNDKLKSVFPKEITIVKQDGISSIK